MPWFGAPWCSLAGGHGRALLRLALLQAALLNAEVASGGDAASSYRETADVADARAGKADESDAVVRAFVAQQQLKAEEAYEDLFGDGLGLELDDDSVAPSRAAFVESYVVEALNRETRRTLKEKGYEVERERSRGDALTDVEKKDSPTTLEGEIERLAVQKRQKRAVRERVLAGKPVELMAAETFGDGSRAMSWVVPCGEPLYRKHVYDAMPSCSPALTALPCRRLVVDDFATQAECAAMIAMMDASFDGLYHQGQETLLVPEIDSKQRMGEDGFRRTADLLERVRAKVASDLNISHLYYSGSLLKRMDYPPINDDMQIDLKHDASNPHVDKANIASYDWSALLYFNSVDEDFGGGELVFNDAGIDRMVRPLSGRLLVFSSGIENLHRVLPMHWGRRYVLSMWFTCSEQHAHPTLGRPPAASAESARHEL